MRKLLIAALAISALALAGCGDDDDGGGNSDVCSNPQSQECQECLAGLLACAFGDACSEEFSALLTCQNETGCGNGEEEDPDCCPDENAAYGACFEEACSEYAACFGSFEG